MDLSVVCARARDVFGHGPVMRKKFAALGIWHEMKNEVAYNMRHCAGASLYELRELP